MSKSPSDLVFPDQWREPAVLPKHVAVIMDGNGRWAKERGAGRLEGHQRGVNNVRSLVQACGELRIRYLTLFAFSSENWRRPQQEIQWLMRLLSRALDREVQSLRENGVRLRFIGDLSRLPNDIQVRMRDATALTESQDVLNLTVAVNYGGKWDVTEACRAIATKVADGDLKVDEVSEQLVESHLSTTSIPEPDLFIRTGGEQRMSNFMLWQLAYTEMYFTETYWPDFNREELHKALDSYARRIRRFGRTDDQVMAKSAT